MCATQTFELGVVPVSVATFVEMAFVGNVRTNDTSVISP